MNTRPKGQTIQIYLPSGEAGGIRIAEITTRLVQVIWIPRLRLAEASQRPELERVGCYLLRCQHATPGEPDLYIGESEEIRRRLNQHHQRDEKLPGWDVAVAIIAKDGSFTKTHGLMLQYLAYQRAVEVGRYRTDQRQRPAEPKVPDALRDDCLDALDQADFLCALLGVPVFARIEQNLSQKAAFIISTKTGADAKGHPTDDGFVVLKGSVCVDAIRDSAPPYVQQTRDRLFADGVLVRQGKSLTFTSDHAFDSPSGAAAIVVGGAANGWDVWKSADGRSLHEAVRIKDGG